MTDIEKKHHYHYQEPAQTHTNIKLIKNTRGFFWEITVVNAKSVNEALDLIGVANKELEEIYGPDE